MQDGKNQNRYGGDPVEYVVLFVLLWALYRIVRWLVLSAMPKREAPGKPDLAYRPGPMPIAPTDHRAPEHLRKIAGAGNTEPGFRLVRTAEITEYETRPDTGNFAQTSGFQTMEFVVTSSSGLGSYRIRLRKNKDKVSLTCTCPAGEKHMQCKHRLALFAGDDSAVVHASHDVLDLQAALTGTRIEGLLHSVSAQEKLVARELDTLKRMRRSLGFAMDGLGPSGK